MAHIEFIVEEPSAEAALKNLLPKLLPETVGWRIHPYNGKYNLIKRLPGRLTGYSHWLPDDWKIVVLVDEDRGDCRKLKEKLQDIAVKAGLKIKNSKNTDAFQVINRIAVEELEAWFFGDVQALVSAYPGISENLMHRAAFRDADAIKGGTWEQLEKILRKAGYFYTGLQKVQTAMEISKHMIPDRNTSKSFNVFVSGLRTIFTLKK